MDSLKLLRGSIQRNLTSFSKYVSKVDAEFTINALHNPPRVAIELQQRLNSATSLLSQFCEVQIQIEALAEDLSAEYLLQEEFTDSYYAAISTAEFLYNKINPEPKRSHSPTSSGTSISSHALASNNAIKLPVINLPKFNGDIETWLEYRDLYTSLIHSNDSITSIHRFHYLRASLTGDALSTIKSLEFSAENYALAWDSLCERYNNSRMLVYNHMKAILNLESLGKESAKKLRHLHDMLFKHVTGLKSLSETQLLFDTFIIHLTASKLDPHTARQWEMLKNSKGTDLPTLDDFKGFLRNTADLLETLNLKQDKVIPEKPTKTSRSFVSGTVICPLCKRSHALYRCEEFLKLSPSDRSAKARILSLCFNCLSKGHSIAQCTSKYTCKTCKFKHHSLLHEKPRVTSSLPLESENSGSQTISAFASNTVQVLLPTATACIIDSSGTAHSVRILLDSASQSNFIASNVCNRLKLQTKPTNVNVTGLSKATSQVHSKCNVQLLSNNSSLKIPDNIQLSDPSYDKPGEIDILIGSSEFWNLMSRGQIHLGPHLPCLQKTKLGWVIAGPLPIGNYDQVQCHLTRCEDVQNQLSRFWEIEHYPLEKVFSHEENACEALFIQDTKRAPDGRFIVSIPFKQSPSVLGDSFQLAVKRFTYLEKRLQSNEPLRERYTSFMKEYEELGHMTKVEPISTEASYYLPHHGVLKEVSLTTKLRVVFNGSAETSSGHSLNSLQMVGPTIQQDLFSILIRFRKNRYAISADIEKMYRQVLIDPSQRSLQRILWRSSPDSTLNVYNLNTVTYGTASASFLAIRSLFQLGIECEYSNPSISKVIKEDFYVDDLLTGSNTLDSAQSLCRTLSSICAQGGFKLCKWISNDPQVLCHIKETDMHPGLYEFGSHENTSTLGLLWSFHTDDLMFSISGQCSSSVTKRTILSSISQIFDPLGLLGPCTIITKILLQQLWLKKLSWDDPVPGHVQEKWSTFCQELPALNNLRIPRHVICPGATDIEFHGFSDASVHGYGACIYLKSIDPHGIIQVSLVCAKSKVAPLKPLTIPKLELCAATLLARLFTHTCKALDIKFMRVVLWSDSTIVLSWLNTAPNLLKTFVCNRVAEIQELTSQCIWRHVPSKDNPADLLSRGVLPLQLIDSTLWWSGPPWLHESEVSWPSSSPTVRTLPELKKASLCFHNVSSIPFSVSDYSSLKRLTAVVAYCLRFVHNCRSPLSSRRLGHLTCQELNYSLNHIVRISQTEMFPDELARLKHNKSVKPSCSIASLNPFLDNNDIIRVGGRLQNSPYEFDKRHPILLTSKHHLSNLIMRQEHEKHHHAGSQLLLCIVRERYWITSGRNLSKQILRSCVQCHRFSAKPTSPIMGNLPISRVQPMLPFTITGVDYAGPYTIKDRKGRGCKTSKSYLCLFVCFTTKAVHLELVTDLTTDSFLLSLRRFIARRGKPSDIYSDNGTNFVGANSSLKELGTFLTNQDTIIPQAAARNGIAWHFIPPHSPHFGGLWEAGVRSIKHHLKRVMGTSILTYEELSTLFVQIEAILNSRPLTPLSTDPEDFHPLTPAHFLIGRTITAAPDSDVTSIPVSRLTTFQNIQAMQQHFWERWSKEYISELQRRTKWPFHQSELKADSLVLIKEDNQPPFRWKMGRITALHPGTDGISRVASIRTSTGIIRRSFAKICPLPIDTKCVSE